MYRQRDKGGPRHKGIHSIRYMKLYKWDWFLLKLSAKCYVPFFFGTLSTCLSVLMGNPCVFYRLHLAPFGPSRR
jgi:hypothetical protein